MDYQKVCDDTMDQTVFDGILKQRLDKAKYLCGRLMSDANGAKHFGVKISRAEEMTDFDYQEFRLLEMLLAACRYMSRITYTKRKGKTTVSIDICRMDDECWGVIRGNFQTEKIDDDENPTSE